jgi:hypothetical protein
MRRSWASEVRRFGDRVEREWGAFIGSSGKARKPPAPLVALRPLLQAFRGAPHLAVLLETHDRAFDFLAWHNRAAWAVARRTRKDDDDVRLARALLGKVKGGVKEPLFIHLDAPAHAWVSDPEYVQKFLRGGGGKGAKRRPIPVAVRYAVWNAWMGGSCVGAGPCHVCGRAINQQEFECGHVVPVALGGCNSVGNLRPICRSCNRSMGAQNLDAFKALHFPPDANSGTSSPVVDMEVEKE